MAVRITGNLTAGTKLKEGTKVFELAHWGFPGALSFEL
jgi:hypothetical protein